MEAFEKLLGPGARGMDLFSEAHEEPLLVHGIPLFPVHDCQMLVVPRRDPIACGATLSFGCLYEIQKQASCLLQPTIALQAADFIDVLGEVATLVVPRSLRRRAHSRPPSWAAALIRTGNVDESRTLSVHPLAKSRDRARAAGTRSPLGPPVPVPRGRACASRRSAGAASRPCTPRGSSRRRDAGRCRVPAPSPPRSRRCAAAGSPSRCAARV